MHFHIITLFPEVCRAYTDASILGRAQKAKKGKGAKSYGRKIEVSYYNPRDFTKDKHKKVDDRPYGGGPGMVLKAEPILRAWQVAVGRKKNEIKVKTLIMSPRGQKFTGSMANRLAERYEHLVLIAGHYEGIDARVKRALKATEVSIGDYVLTGGELPALAIVDAIARQVPGVLGSDTSLESKRLASGELYTRPETLTFKRSKYHVPKVLKSGNHRAIEAWKTKKTNAK